MTPPPKKKSYGMLRYELKKEKNMTRFGAVRLKWKTGFN